MSANKKRFIYSVLFFIVLFAEILIALFINDNFIRPYVGDVLVVIVIYFFIRIFIPEGAKYLPIYVFIFALCTEIMQYFNIVALLGLENNSFMRILIGSTFDMKDIFCYLVGCIMIWLLQKNVFSKFDINKDT